ncbi:unnamed protein product [Blepharisma stoltei]|uniref:TNFR-Cys domain-containing protein n=1 Tax=Blepharisma stoltei TaxID=1481888 RepID=A0AAU9KBX5_9CILI|nr:unnamed protein product [Blepharisma stoltei]
MNVFCKCTNSYYLADDKVCVNSCPSNFDSNTWVANSCGAPNGSDAIIFELKFTEMQDLTATYITNSANSNEKFLNPGSISYNSATHNSPLPTVDRGFYFASTSSMTSDQHYTPALYFTLNLWIKPLASGEILNTIFSSTKYIRIWADSSGVYKFSGTIYDSSNNANPISGASTISYTSSWHKVSIVLEQISCTETTISFYINEIGAGSSTISSSEARFVGGVAYTWTLGNISPTNSFRGFIYWLQARADTMTSSFSAMASQINCVDNQYWDGSACQNCDSSCPTWPWCIRGGSCSICYTLDCISCYGYSVSMCTSCTTGIVPGCCDYLATTCTQTWSNTACNSGKVLIGGICLHACPYGFGNCAAVSTAVITADFTGSFSGSYSTALITATSSSSYNFWNSPENSDPFPVKSRGLFFNSNQFLSGSVNLSNTWSIGLWVYAISGTIISHSSGKLTIDSSGISFSLEKWDGASATNSASQSITLNVWNYISYSVRFANKITTATPYFNKVAGTSTTTTNYVFRLPSGGTLYIGKGSTNFNGFIANFMLWQTTISDFSGFYSINTLTGGSVSVLWPCDYYHYYDGSACQSCLGSCTIGCTRGTSCYICDDFLCSKCSSFWSGACTSCISNASGSPCQCNSGYYQPTNQALCSACYTGCAHCTGPSYYLCTACSSNYFLYNSNFCVSNCATGYTENSSSKTCVFNSFTGLSIIFYDKIVLDSISGVSVGSTNTNTYPTYDSNDPYPAYLRGYYFTGTTYNTNNLQNNDSSTSSCTSPCSICPSDYNCPDSCSLSQYNNGSSCVNCKASCTKGCRSTDTCRLCKTKECNSCTSFSGSCTSCITNAESDGSNGCKCKNNAFWSANLESCELCDSLCAVCKQTTYFECNSCVSGKQLVGVLCLNDCPFGYGSSCSPVSTVVIDLCFYTDFQGGYGTFTTGADSSKYQHFASPETVDPIPTYLRGLYFDGNKYLLSSQSIYISHSFTIGVWIYEITNGDFLQKQTRLKLSSTGAITAIMDDRAQTSSTVTLSPTSSFTYWTYLSITIYYTSNASVLSLYINGVSAGSTTIAEKIYRDDASTNLQLGKSSSSGFVGFIFYFQLWNAAVTDFTTIINGFTFCGSGNKAACLWSCDMTTYKSGSSCVACNSCSKGCRRAISCNICDDSLCSVCTGFETGKCTTCVTNASKNPTNCACNPGFVASTDGFSCISCPIGCSICNGSGYYQCTSCQAGYYFLNIQCLTECPWGYNQNSATHSCDLSSTAYSLMFSNIILLDTISGVNVGLSNTNSYPNYDTNDPYPSYLRGYYYNYNSYLKISFMFSPSFSISLWIRPLAAGFVISKYISTTTIVQVKISSGYPQISLLLSDSSTTISVTGASNILAGGWFYISFDCTINSDGKTTIASYIDGTSPATFTTSTPLYLLDSQSGDLYIGHYSSGFTGFLWNVKIYSQNNNALNDFKTTGCLNSCTKCPSDSTCLDSCSISQYNSGSACTNCIATCDKGCRNSDTCRLCKTKECATCREFTGGNSCLTCITNAVSDGSGGCTCAANAFWISSSQTCEFCDDLCSTCIKTTYFECSACSGSYQLVGHVCLKGCPYGFDASCSSVSTAVIDQSFNTDFQGSYGIFTTGTTSTSFQFFNTPESYDPIPTYKRGLFFDGTMYLLSSTSVLLSHSFSIGSWIYIITHGDWLEKQTQITVLSSTGTITANMENPSQTLTLQSLSSSSSLNSWIYLSYTFSYNLDTTNIVIYINGALVATSAITNYIIRDVPGTKLILGKSSASGFIGFINTFQLWNVPISDFSSYVNNIICGTGLGHSCLWSCDLSNYWSGSSYSACNSCSKGCVRAGTCNICYDLLCSVCTGFGSGKCIQCVSNASGAPCACNTNYMTSSDGFSCVACYNGCSNCTSPSGSNCVLVNEKIFDLDLNTLNRVIYDKANSIPVITGSSKQFYPDYEVNDPIPAYLRGFYFNGQTSVLRLPEYSNYTSPRLVLTSTFTISLWLNTESLYGALLSKHDISDNYSSLFSISLISSKPSISLTINSSPLFFMCQKSVNNYEWSHIEFTFETTQSGDNALSCYINGLFDSSEIAGSGIFQDKVPHTAMSIGAQLSSQTVYNYYQGFIYTIQIYNILKPVNSLSTVFCTENCSVCPTNQICIPNCKINEYWSGPGYNVCYRCNIKCTKSCRDWRSSCSLCNNLLCKNCIDYSSFGCVACKENAINPDSCICDVKYVLDTSNNSTCIVLKPGGFRGMDGIFYSCPKLCSICESSIKCTSCVANAGLKNDLCYCNLGFNGSTNCTSVYFSAKLSALSDNSLYLTFSDNLVNALSASNFTVTIEQQGEVSCKIEQINGTCYYISLKIEKAISKGTLATIEFINLEEMRSVSNGVLNSSEISVPLNSYDPAPYSATIESVTSQASAGSQAAISGAVALSIVNPNPSSLWSMMNTLQILSYLTLSGIPLSSKMSSFLNNLNSFNLFPNAFTYIIDKNEGNTPYSQAKEFGFDSDLILINQGNDFTLILASLAVFPGVFFLSRCSYRWLGKKFTKTLKGYQFAFYLRFWIQCYLELGAAASVGFITAEFGNVTQITNLTICLAVYIILFATPPAYFWFSYKNRNRIQSREKGFTSLFDTFFYEFRNDKGFLAMQYYFVFFARRLIYIINLVFLREYPQTEVTINIVLSLITIMHLGFFRPYEDPILQITNLVTEIMICLVMISTSVYLFDLEQEIVSGVESAIVGIVLTVMAIQTFSSVFIFARTLFEVIHRKLTRAGIMRNTIQARNSQLTKIER